MDHPHPGCPQPGDSRPLDRLCCMIPKKLHRHAGAALLALAMLLTALVYIPGLSGSWLFDDYPNIVDNHGVQPSEATVASLVRAALASPSSEFKRPLASLSFAANYLAAGLNPYGWKVTNLVIHLLNGWLVFLLSRQLLQATPRYPSNVPAETSPVGAASAAMALPGNSTKSIAAEAAPTQSARVGIIAALIAACWMLLPINLTAVLYVVQRMESMANAFVLLGLLGYVASRRQMLALRPGPAGTESFLPRDGAPASEPSFLARQRGFLLCLLSIAIPAAIGVQAKETAVMLPLYALLIEWSLFRFAKPRQAASLPQGAAAKARKLDSRIIGLFALVLVLPIAMGLTWLLPDLLKPEAWATRDFTLGTRLLSETRIVVDYITWTLLPTPHALSFYHDDFIISRGLLTPWTTLASLVFLGVLIVLMLRLRLRRPLAALGIALFLGCHLLTGTVLPLELIYEHRNYFASFGLMLSIVPLLAAPQRAAHPVGAHPVRDALGMIGTRASRTGCAPTEPQPSAGGSVMALLRYALLAALMLYWTSVTAVTAYAWGNPQRLAESLAARAPQSPRAQYELGRNYIINSHYDPASPYTRMAYAPLERAAKLPDSSILPQQALIFMNSRMHLPLKDAWWDSMIAKLKAHDPGVQDESSLAALTQCVRELHCDLPQNRMTAAFTAALSHPHPSARLLATYGDYAWNVLGDQALGEHMTADAVKANPDEPAYRITLVRMLVAQDRIPEARGMLLQLQRLNFGGRLTKTLQELHALPGMQ